MKKSIFHLDIMTKSILRHFICIDREKNINSIYKNLKRFQYTHVTGN